MFASQQLLALDSPKREIAFTDRKQNVVLQFRRLRAEDWVRYFNGLVIESERVPAGGSLSRVDLRTAGDDLVEDALVGATGYKLKDGGEFTDRADWKLLIPYRHRVAAIDALQSVSADSENLDLVIDPDVEEVQLKSLWNVELDDNGNAQNVCHSGLIHRFRRATPEQRRRYNRAQGESRVVGGRNGRTMRTSQHKTWASLYDEMIQSVSGYSVGGEDVAGNISQIQTYMDYCHKVVAVQELFSFASVDTGESE